MRNIEKNFGLCNGLCRKFSAQGSAQQCAALLVGQSEPQHVHEFGDGGFGGHVVAAEHPRLLEPEPRFVELHRDPAAAALGDVEDDDAALDGFVEHADEPLACGCVACAEGLQHDGPQPGSGEHRTQNLLAEPREELDDDDAVGQPAGDAQLGVGGIGPEDGREVIGDVDTHLGQGRIIVGPERAERFGAALGGAVGAEKLVLEIERDLGHGGLAAAAGPSDFDGRDEVLAAVGAQDADGNLAPGENHGLGEVLEQKTQGRSGVGHGVGAVQDDEAVVTGVVVADDPGQREPVGGSHVGRIYDGRHGLHVDVDVEPLERGELVVDGAEVERHEGTRFGVGLHADGTSGVDNQNRGFGTVHGSTVCGERRPNMRSALAEVMAAMRSGVVFFNSATLAHI